MLLKIECTVIIFFEKTMITTKPDEVRFSLIISLTSSTHNTIFWYMWTVRGANYLKMISVAIFFYCLFIFLILCLMQQLNKVVVIRCIIWSCVRWLCSSIRVSLISARHYKTVLLCVILQWRVLLRNKLRLETWPEKQYPRRTSLKRGYWHIRR